MSITKVLIVDDEIDFAETLAERLALRNFETDVATSAEEGIEKIRAGWTPNVVILDLKMPGLDGLETLDLIKQNNPEIEVILLTGHGSTDSGIAGMKRGLFDYLMKPVEIGTLIAKINEAAKASGNIT